MARIVVGFDGSAGGERALEWAAEEAERRRAELEIVCATRQPLAVGPLTLDVQDQLRAATEEIAAEASDRLAQHHDIAEIRTMISERHPGDALIEASHDADLLVVGSNGLGALAGLFLGSVGLQCVTHAHCPVVVVRPA